MILILKNKVVFISFNSIAHTLGVCDIYCLRYYWNCCFNDVQFDNIESFAKTKQNAYKMHAYISLRGDEGVKQCTRTFRACSFTA